MKENEDLEEFNLLPMNDESIGSFQIIPMFSVNSNEIQKDIHNASKKMVLICLALKFH